MQTASTKGVRAAKGDIRRLVLWNYKNTNLRCYKSKSRALCFGFAQKEFVARAKAVQTPYPPAIRNPIAQKFPVAGFRFLLLLDGPIVVCHLNKVGACLVHKQNKWRWHVKTSSKDLYATMWRNSDCGCQFKNWILPNATLLAWLIRGADMCCPFLGHMPQILRQQNCMA